MSEYNMQFTGWKAIAVIVVLIGVFGVRLMTFNDKKGDKALMKQLEILLVEDYFPEDVEKLKAAYEAGDSDNLEKVAKSVTSTKVNVELVQASYPLFDLSTRKEVVIKVTYSLNDDSGTRGRVTTYYLFNHSSLGNIWQYVYETSATRYYLNFV